MSQNPGKWSGLNRGNTEPGPIWPGLVLFALFVLAVVTLVAGAEAGIALGIMTALAGVFVHRTARK